LEGVDFNGMPDMEQVRLATLKLFDIVDDLRAEIRELQNENQRLRGQREMLKQILDYATQLPTEAYSGGIHTPPETRVLLLMVAHAMRAKRIIETGYDAGMTTRLLADSGASVLGIDNLAEYPAVDKYAREILKDYPNVELLCDDAHQALRGEPSESVDLIFVDDRHKPTHVNRVAWEVKRVLKPGGIAAFHDVKYANLMPVINEVFEGWQMIVLPAISPEGQSDLGLALVRKPDESEV
jgi:predicted O-methyltransferase YrrM